MTASDPDNFLEGISNMKILLLLLVTALFWLLVFLPYIARAYARNISVDIIHRHRPTTEKQIIRCIAILNWSNNWIINLAEPDGQRINQLRKMLDEMQHPHGSNSL